MTKALSGIGLKGNLIASKETHGIGRMVRAVSYVAVVDDDPSVCKALKRLLTAASFQTRTFVSALEFIDTLTHGRPNCLVTDIQIPEFSGFDLHRYLRNTDQPVPTIVITAFDDTAIRSRCLTDGAVAYLTKPIDGPALLSALHAATQAALPNE
jgi:FixJ family two-component response regulator